MSETSFLNIYKLISDAPDPYPLLDAAVDQTVKVAEARMLESEVKRLKEENADLKRQVGEGAALEQGRKKAEGKVVELEEKVGLLADVDSVERVSVGGDKTLPRKLMIDGRHDR